MSKLRKLPFFLLSSCEWSRSIRFQKSGLILTRVLMAGFVGLTTFWEITPMGGGGGGGAGAGGGGGTADVPEEFPSPSEI